MKCARPKCSRVVRRTGLCAQHYKPASPVDAAPVIRRYQLLRSRGLPVEEIARQAGLHRDTLRQMGDWSEGRVLKETADKLMAVRVPARIVPSGVMVPATGTRRRLQGLARQGHSLGAVARELGISQQAVTSVLKQEQVTAATAASIADVFDRWQFIVGGSVRARNWATRRGWAPPLSWDEESIDDPAATPVVGEARWVPFMDRLAELEYLNIPVSERPAWLGIQRDSYERQLVRHGLKEAV